MIKGVNGEWGEWMKRRREEEKGKKVRMIQCSLCRRPIFNPNFYYVLDCDHEFHIQCLNLYFQRYSYRCPTCRERLSPDDRHFFEDLFYRRVAIAEEDLSEDSGYSSGGG